MGWYTYSTIDGQIIIKIDETLAKIKLRKYMVVFRIGMYVLDTGTDYFMLYMLYNYPLTGHYFGHVYWQFVLVFMLLPIFMTAIAVICDISTKKDCGMIYKILLALLILMYCPTIPLYFLIVDAHDAFKTVPSGCTEDNSARVRLNEALLESLPQVMIQTSIIMNTTDLYSRNPDIPGVQTWQIIVLAISVINFSFTVASSSYLFKANITRRLEFFVYGLVSVTSRLMMGCLSYKSTATLLIASISVWAAKRVFHGCRCSFYYVPLAKIHRTCNLRSLLHVPVTWVVTVFINCFTLSGLFMSTLNLAWSFYVTINFQINDASSPGTTYVITCAVFAGLMTFVVNVMNVAFPKYRRSIGDVWLNKDPETGEAQLY